MKKIRHILEYLGLHMVLGLVDVLSVSASEKLACGLSDVLYNVGRKRRETARNNIKRSGIASEPGEIDRIARASYRHFATLIVESLKSDRVFTESNWKDMVEFDVPAETMALLEEEGKGIILVSGHLGNWEVAAQLISYIKPVTAIIREMNNPYTNRLILDRKARERLVLTPKHDANSARFLTVLKKGGVLALLNDQYARDRGMNIDFFGIPASTHTAVPLLHFVTKVPIVFGYCVRTGPMKFKFKASAPLSFKPSGKRQEDIRRVLEHLSMELENAVREYPDQYLWAHRRWR